MKGKMKKILGLAISAAMAVSAVMPWTGVTAFAEGESQEPALVMEQTGEPEEEPAAENETETISARNSSDIRENGHSPVVNIRYPDGTETPVENVSWGNIDKGNAKLVWGDWLAPDMTLKNPESYVPEEYVYDADNSTVTVTVDVDQEWEGIPFFSNAYYLVTENPTFTIAVKEPESNYQPVYVYVEVVTEGADDDAEVNSSGYYTYGKIQMEIPAATEADVESNLYGEYAAKIEEALTEFKSSNLNDWIQMDTVEWFRLHADNGANDYVDAGTYTWHLDGRIVATYPLTYHANGGTFEGIDGQTVEDTNKFVAGQPVTPRTDKELKLTREGYTFKGWAMSADAEEAYDKDIFMSENGLTLYAVWELAGESAPDTFTVQYKWSSATDGKALPAELNESLPVDTAEYVLNSETGYYEPDLKVDETYTKGSTFKAEDGTWTFSGWSVSTPPDENGVVAIEGTWTFEADEEPPVVEPGDDNVTIDKTATDLVDDTTDVTLSIGATEGKDKVAVMFILDKSTSQGMRDEAAQMLDELKTKENTDILYNVVIFSGTATSTGWKNIQDDAALKDTKDNFVNKETTSGTNMTAGILEAEAQLAALPEDYDDTYLITLSDGITYVWSETPGEVLCVPVQGLGANGQVETAAQNGADTWAMMYEYGKSITDIYGSFNDFLADIPEKIDATEQGGHIQDYYGENSKTNPITTYIYDDAKTENVAATYACGPDFAMYYSATGYAQLAEKFDHAYAFAVPEENSDGSDNTTNWSNYPWGQELMMYLASISNAGGGDVGNADAEEIFAGIKNDILYEIEEGTVTDVIGDDFDFAGLDTVRLTVGTDVLTGTISGNTISFDDGNYVVTYYPNGTENDSREQFKWEINVPVEAEKGVALTYTLNLVNKSTTPGSHTVPTNEEAVLDYTSTTGAENQKEFPVPEVTYTVADTSEPSDPGPDNPPYIPDGGNEEEPSEPTEEIPETEIPQTSLPTDDTSVPDAIPGEPSAPSTEEIPDNTTPQTAQPPETGARAAGSVVLLAGAAAVAALTLRRKK